MPEPVSCDYATVRLVPRVEREEFVNVGVILFCRQRRFLDAIIELDERRVSAFAPDLDLDEARSHLDLIPLVCRGGPSAGPIGELSAAERFHWLVAPRSTVIQVSAVHSLVTREPRRTLEQLATRLLGRPFETSGGGES